MKHAYVQQRIQRSMDSSTLDGKNKSNLRQAYDDEAIHQIETNPCKADWIWSTDVFEANLAWSHILDIVITIWKLTIPLYTKRDGLY